MRRFEKSEKQRIGRKNRWCKMNMSLNSYAKIERGEIKLSLNKLEQIAQILDIIEEKYLLSN